jgi:hypothetical protein
MRRGNWSAAGNPLPQICPHCTGRGDAHFLTCPLLQLPHDESTCPLCRPVGAAPWADVRAMAASAGLHEVIIGPVRTGKTPVYGGES